VRASHHFLSEEDIQFYKPLIYHDYLKVLSLFGTHSSSGRLAGFIGLAGAKIEMLFVHPDDFGKGIGSELCLFAVRDLGATQVDVNEDNEGACGFYQKLGFKVIGRSPLDPSGNPFPILHLLLNEEATSTN
jgi:putative acetyltransferase